MKCLLQTAQISYNICFHQTHVHYPQYLLTFFVFVLRLSVGKNVECVSFLLSDLATNKRIDKVPSLKYIFTGDVNETKFLRPRPK